MTDEQFQTQQAAIEAEQDRIFAELQAEHDRAMAALDARDAEDAEQAETTRESIDELHALAEQMERDNAAERARLDGEDVPAQREPSEDEAQRGYATL